MQILSHHFTGRFLRAALTFWVVVLLTTAAVGQDAMPNTNSVRDIREDVVDPAISVSKLETLLVPLTVDELAETAQVWQGILRSALTDIARLNNAISSAPEDKRDALRTKLAGQGEFLTELNEKYSVVLTAWENKGAVAEDLAKLRHYQTAVTTDTVRTTDPVTLLKGVGAWLISKDGGLGFLLQLGGFFVAIWAMFFVAGLARRAAKRGLDKVPNISKLLVSFVLVLVYWLTFSVGIMFTLALFGVNITPLFAVFGGASFILGFALQEVLGNLASGLMLMILKPFDMGDFIEAAGIAGFVDEMSVVSTQIRTFDNQIISVPNSKIWGGVITNVNASKERRVDLVFGIAYSDNAAQAIDVLNTLVAAESRCLKDPEPAIFVGELGDSSVNVFCRPWVKSEDYWEVYWGLTGQAKERFDEEGISIPFPQRDVHLIPAEVSAKS